MATKISRRSVLDWLGKATVLSLGGSVVSSCTRSTARLLLMGDTGSDTEELDSVCCDTEVDTESDSATAGSDTDSATGADTGLDSEMETDCTNPAEFPFDPGEKAGALLSNWNVRTVDPQFLSQILAQWSLTIDGMVDNPVTLSFGSVVDLPRTDILVDFHCVEGWSVLDVPWNGVHLSEIFSLVSPSSGATHLTLHCVGDLYTESIPIEWALEDNTLLAYGVLCNTLPLQHGFPLRLVVPRKFGYKSPKYVYRIELTDGPTTGYWEQFGYNYEADVQAHRLRPGRY